MRKGWISAGLAIVTILVYLPSFPGAFHYDDYPLILENSRVTESGFPMSIFLEQYGGRPLTLFSFYLNYQLFGESPAHFHVVSVFLHVGVVLLLFLWGAKIWGRFRLPALVALLFAVAPSQVHPVNYIWSRSILLMAFFGLAALFWADRNRVVVAVLFCLSIWSRSEGLLFALPLYLSNRRLKWPLIVVGGLNAAGFLFGYARHSPVAFGWTYEGWWQFWRLAPVLLVDYLELLFLDHQFAIVHAVPEATLLETVLYLGLFLGAAVLLWRRRKEWPELFQGAAWFLWFLLPTLMIPNTSPFDEGRVYMASAGAFVFPALALERIWEGLSRDRYRAVKVLGGVLGLLWLGSMIWRTQERHHLWQDDVALWQEAVLRDGEHELARYNLGVALARRGSIREAARQFERARRLNPRDDMSYAGLGFCAESSGDWTVAVSHYTRALELNPENRYARESLARVQSQTGAERNEKIE